MSEKDTKPNDPPVKPNPPLLKPQPQKIGNRVPPLKTRVVTKPELETRVKKTEQKK